MKLIRVGVDLAKHVYQVHGVDRKEKAIWRRKPHAGELAQGIARDVEPGCEIGMESCVGLPLGAHTAGTGFKVS